MEVEVIIFLSAIAVLSLWWGISSFIGDRAQAYSTRSYPTRMIMMGVTSSILLLTGLVRVSNIDTRDYLISYIHLALAILCVLFAILFGMSDRVNSFWWSLVRRKEQKSDRKYLIYIFLILGFGFSFAFFLFYPPFLSIG